MKRKCSIWHGLPLVGVLLSGCGSIQPQAGNDASSNLKSIISPESSVPSSNSESKKYVNLTRFSNYENQWSVSTKEGASFSNAYTRLLIRSDIKADGDGKDSTKEHLPQSRNGVARFLLGKEYAINLTANVVVGAFETTVPLATIEHQSNSDGEHWSHAIHHDKMNFPLFLVKADGSASVPVVKLAVNGSKSYASHGAAATVQALLGVARVSGQMPGVVTRLSEQSTKDTSRALDDAISKLFASGITEEHWSDRDLRTFSSDGKTPQGVKLTFNVPKDENDWKSELETVGSWTITFDYPRPSIFSDWRICKNDDSVKCGEDRTKVEQAILAGIKPGQVLNFNLLAGDKDYGTVRSFLARQDWYSAAQIDLANSKLPSSIAVSFCKRIVNEITGLGLNEFDAQMVVKAVVQGMPMPAGTNMDGFKDCPH